jgi:selenocysteine lyase/cysteine desulfurase
LLQPPIIGGWNVQSPNFIAQREITYAADGQKFEPGAYSHAAIAGLRAAVELLLETGLPEISTKILSLTRALSEQIEPMEFEFLSPINGGNRSGILTFRHSDVTTSKIADLLSAEGVVVSLRFDRAGCSWLRVSPHFYNTSAEIERVGKVLNRAVAA